MNNYVEYKINNRLDDGAHVNMGLSIHFIKYYEDQNNFDRHQREMTVHLFFDYYPVPDVDITNKILSVMNILKGNYALVNR